MVLQMLISSIVFDYFSPPRLSSSLSFFLYQYLLKKKKKKKKTTIEIKTIFYFSNVKP